MRRRLSTRLGLAAVALLLGGLLAATPAAAASQTGDRSYRKVGYFIQWGIYGRNFFVKDLVTSGSAAKLTHVNYAFANVSQDGRCFEANIPGEGDAWADYQLRKLKARYPHLRVLLSIGGWTWSTYFSNAAHTSASRRAFVASCIDLFIKGNLPQLGSVEGGPARRPASSTASTWTGSGPAPRASPAT
jgi:chitinase